MRADTEDMQSKADMPYEPPALTPFGTVEDWTRGSVHNGIVISIII